MRPLLVTLAFLIVISASIGGLIAAHTPYQPDLPGYTAPVPGRFGWCRYYETHGLPNGAVRLCPTPAPQHPPYIFVR